MSGEPQAGCRNAGAALATVALLWLAGFAAHAEDIDARQLSAAFDDCLAEPRIAAAGELPESIRRDSQKPAPKARKKRKRRGAERPLRDDLRLFCPGLHAAIDRSSFALLLPDDWGERVTPRKLHRLRALMLPDSAQAPAHRLDTRSVGGFLDEMQAAQAAQDLSLWQRFKAWLADILEKNSGGEKSGWLADWLEKHKPSEEFMTLIGYGLLVLLVAGAGWIVYSELRAAGMLGARTRAGGMRGAGAGGAPAQRPAPTLAEAGEEEQPALLIAMLLEQLRRDGRIADRLSMTHRELASAASFDTVADRETFSMLIAVAEKLRYAAIAPAKAHLRQAIDGARLLLSRLLQPPRSAA